MSSPGSGTNSWRVALVVLLVASVFWLGGHSIRALIGNELLEPGTLELKTSVPPDAERMVYRLLAVTGIMVLVSYAVVLVSSLVVLLGGPWALRNNGWLLMSALLLYLFIPVEVFTLILDVKLIRLEFFSGADLSVFREAFLARAAALAGAPLVALLCYYTIFILAVFQPMTRRGSPTP